MIRALQGNEDLVKFTESPVHGEFVKNGDRSLNCNLKFNFYLNFNRSVKLEADKITVEILKSEFSAAGVLDNLEGKNEIQSSILDSEFKALERLDRYFQTNLVQTSTEDLTGHLEQSFEQVTDGLFTEKALGRRSTSGLEKFNPSLNVASPEVSDFFAQVLSEKRTSIEASKISQFSSRQSEIEGSNFVEDVRLYPFPIQEICKEFRDQSISKDGESAMLDALSFLQSDDLSLRVIRKIEDGEEFTSVEADPNSSAAAYLATIYNSEQTSQPLYKRKVRRKRSRFSVPITFDIDSFSSLLFCKITVTNSRGVILQRQTKPIPLRQIFADSTRPLLQPILNASLTDSIELEYPSINCSVVRRDAFNEETVIMVKYSDEPFSKFARIKSEINEVHELKIPARRGSGTVRIRAITVRKNSETSSVFSETSVSLSPDTGSLRERKTTRALQVRTSYSGPDSDGLYNVTIKTRVPNLSKSEFSEISVRRLSIDDDASDPSAGKEVVFGIQPGASTSDTEVPAGTYIYVIDGQTLSGDSAAAVAISKIQILDDSYFGERGQSGTDGTILKVTASAEKGNDFGTTKYSTVISQDSSDDFDIILDLSTLEFQLFDDFGEQTGALHISDALSVESTEEKDGNLKLSATFANDVIQQNTISSHRVGTGKAFNTKFRYRTQAKGKA